MRRAEVFFKDESAGIITQYNDGTFSFWYHTHWVENSSKPSISLTLSKHQCEFRSPHLFPFFYNIMPEGSNREAVCYYNRLDTSDDFGILLTVAQDDTIGAVRVVKIENDGNE